jgi:hypothetical protein
MAISQEPFLRPLRIIRLRMAVIRGFNVLPRLAALGAGALLGWGLLRYFWWGLPPWSPAAAVYSLCAVVAGGGFWMVLRWPRAGEAAAELDRRAQTRDRFVTGLAFAAGGPEATLSPLGELALADCVEFASRPGFHRHFPVARPRGLRWMLAPLLSLAFLQWHGEQQRGERLQARLEGEARVGQELNRLHALASETQRRAQEQGDPVLEDFAGQLRKAAADLKEQARNPGEAEKAAKREVSRLEQMLQAMQGGAAPFQTQDLKPLVEELARDPATRDIAQAMQEGRWDEAARGLEQAAAGAAAEAAEKRLNEALARLAEQRAHSQVFQQLLKEIEQAAGRGALNKLRQLLQKLAQEGRPGQSPQPQQAGAGRQQALKDLLSALQNLKHGQSPNGELEPHQAHQMQGEGRGEGRVSVQSFGKPGGENQESAGGLPIPTGLAGGGRESGTTVSPFGDDQDAPGETGADLALGGRLGSGETLSISTPAAGDQSKAARRYKELYEAMAPEAREAVMQETIPIGARFFVKRYFESIRPR